MKELRIGVVLYGGVSLAIYMNGITTELWHAIRASRLPPDKLTGTEKLYRALLDEVAEESGTEIRIIVDTIAGSSAGGVNGVVLGHAIANGSDAAVLRDVWVNQAGIESLRRRPGEAAGFLVRALVAAAQMVPKLKPLFAKIAALGEIGWVRDCTYSLSRNGRETFLNGHYFARMIAASLADMRKKMSGAPLLDRRHVLDLYLTQTDLYGWERHLPVSGKYHSRTLTEPTHAHCLHFRKDGLGSDFTDEYALTYAARTTAGFPLAFAPINTLDMEAAFLEAQQDAAPDLAAFERRHLSEHALSGRKGELVWMADGGFLDNRPFTYVTEAIEGKAADHEVTRAVVYVDPDPDDEAALSPDAPPALKDLGGRAYRMFRDEPILQDLLRLADRNGKVARIKEMEAAETDRVRAIIEKLGQHLPPPSSPLPALAQLAGWSDAVNQYLLDRAATGYAGYVQLKARRAAETLAEVVCRALGFKWETQHGWLVRETVRRMMEDAGALGLPQFTQEPVPAGAAAAAQSRSGTYKVSDAQRKLLGGFDFSYRLRRLRHIVRAVNGLYRELPALGDAERALRPILDEIKASLASVAENYQNAIGRRDDVRKLVLAVFAGGEAALAAQGEQATIARVERDMRDIGFDPASALASYRQPLQAIEAGLMQMFVGLANAQSRGLDQVLAGIGDKLAKAGAPASFDEKIAVACVDFALIDVAIFPMMDSAGIEDLIAVDTLRIAPADSRIWANRGKLKGAEMGAFAGFFQIGAREYDIAIGRLDGAERLVDLILMTAFGEMTTKTAVADRNRRDGLRDAYLRLLSQAIVKEEAALASPAIAAELRQLRMKPAPLPV